MNPDEAYPMTEPTPTLGQILSSLTSLHAKVDALTLQQAGDRGLIALGVVSPKFRKETPLPDDWIVWNGGECPVPEGTQGCIRMRDGIEWKAAGDISRCAWWWSDPGDDCSASMSDIVAYIVTRPAQEQKHDHFR